MSALNKLTIVSLVLLSFFNAGCSLSEKKERQYVLISSADNTLSGLDYKEPNAAREELQRQVNLKLALGYHLVGGVTVVRHPTPQVLGVMMFQAMAE